MEREFSSWAQVKSGISQGSVLGPTLFVMYINDMPDAINSMCQLFADDAKIFKRVRSTDDNKKLQGDLDSLTEWSTRWQLPCNVEKCKSLHIGRNNRKHIYEMDGKELDQDDFTYKLMTGKTNISKDDFFTSTNVTTRGHQFKIFKRHASKLPRINTFSNGIVNDWNQLP